MELPETIEVINKRLIEHFGIDTQSTQAMWRVVWSEDEYEKRLTEYSDGGILLLKPEVRLLPKYKQWVDHKYILERLVAVPDCSMPELPTVRQSYEPIRVLEDGNGNPLPPKWEALKFIIDVVYAAMGKSNLAKYTDGIRNQDDAEEARQERIKKIIEELSGEESGLMGSTLNSGNSIIVPQNFDSRLS